MQDAWLDSVDVEPKYAGKGSLVTNNEDDVDELSSEDIGMMKRRIADVLEPGETVSYIHRYMRWLLVIILVNQTLEMLKELTNSQILCCICADFNCHSGLYFSGLIL